MPLIQIHQRVHSVTPSQKMLKSSCWRKFAGIVAFIQVTLFLLLSLLLVSGAIIQLYTGVAPYQNEFFHSIRAGVLVTVMHRDIMEAQHFGISGPPELVAESLDKGAIQNGVSISTDLKEQLEEADWGTIFSLYLFAAIIAASQCWSGAKLLRASLKWRAPEKALVLMESWRSSMTSFRNYIIGFLASTLLFATEVSGLVVFALAILWMILCLLSFSAYGYYKELNLVVSPPPADDDAFEDI